MAERFISFEEVIRKNINFRKSVIMEAGSVHYPVYRSTVEQVVRVIKGVEVWVKTANTVL